MADVSRLVGLLQDYHTVLTDQRRRVGEAHRALAERYGALDRVYEGEGAAEFKSAWRQADEAFEAYTEGVPEHAWRHTRKGDKYVCESLGGWSGTGWQGWSLAVHPDVTRSTCGPSRCLHSDLSVRVNGRRRARPTAVA